MDINQSLLNDLYKENILLGAYQQLAVSKDKCRLSRIDSALQVLLHKNKWEYVCYLYISVLKKGKIILLSPKKRVHHNNV